MGIPVSREPEPLRSAENQGTRDDDSRSADFLRDEKRTSFSTWKRSSKRRSAGWNRAESSFIDEIDKIAGATSRRPGPDVVERGRATDLLPIVEGSTVNTKYGVVRTDSCAVHRRRAFNVAKPSELIPEFQGRFPIRVELSSLGEADFVRILTETGQLAGETVPGSPRVRGVRARLPGRRGQGDRRGSPAAANDRRRTSGRAGSRRSSPALLEDVLFGLPDRARRR